MPLPPNFSEWEHLQSQILRVHNSAVRQWFKNQANDDVSTPKASLKHACLIKDNDSINTVQLRLWLFEFLCNHIEVLIPSTYGIPKIEYFREQVFEHPQVKLVFESDLVVVGNRSRNRYMAELTFRLTDETYETINRAKAETIARAIKNHFTNPIFQWQKGKFIHSYTDRENGYRFKIYAPTAAEAERVIRQILAIRNHSFEGSRFQTVTHNRDYPIDQGTQRIYGRIEKKPVRRPEVLVKFAYAEMIIWGRPNPLGLVDTRAKFRSPIERVL